MVWTKERKREYQNEYNQKNRKQVRQWQRQYREKNREHLRQLIRDWKGRNKERHLRNMRRFNNSSKGKACRDRWKAKLRLEVLIHYSKSNSNTPQCVCCGERTLEFLTIDHVNGRKGLPRAERQLAGIKLYTWLRKNSYPTGFQVLCANCNLAKGVYGLCPHQINLHSKDKALRMVGTPPLMNKECLEST